VKIVDHNGLMDYFITSTSNNIVTVDSTSRIRKGMVCVTYFTPSTPFVTITDVINSTSFSTSSSLGLSSNNYVFIYADSGLIDSSKDVFCAGVIGKLLTAPVSVGATTLTVSSLEPSANVRILAVGGNQITLNTPTTSAIDTGSTIVFAPSNSSGDKQQCILPLDLSPPFLGTNEGLDSRGKRIVPTVSANLHITTLALSSNSAVVSAANSTDVFDAALVINQIYRIKARQII
jgi:hypothetical protein